MANMTSRGMVISEVFTIAEIIRPNIIEVKPRATMERQISTVSRHEQALG